MKQQVTDITDALQGLSKQIASMQKTIDSQHQTICEINRTSQRQLKEIRDLKKIIEKKDERIKDLEDWLARYENPGPPKDSSNSSTPPSKEPIKSEIARRTKSLRGKSNKPVGGQKGHAGTIRMVVDIPDEVEEVSANYCKECGRDLSDIKGELDYRMQEIDLPEIKPIYRERRFYKKVCACGCCNTGYAPRKRGGNAITFGKRAKAVATCLHEVQCIPYERLQSMLATLFNLEISQGTPGQHNRGNAGEIKTGHRPYREPYKGVKGGWFRRVRVLLQRQPRLVIDSTDGIPHTCFPRNRQRCENKFGDSLKNMVAVTDRHSAYFTINFLDNQISLAHLLRNLEFLNDIDNEQTWAREMQELLREAIHTRNENPYKSISPKGWLDRLDSLLKQNLDSLKKEFNEVKKGILKRRDNIFKFLENPAVPPDNNGSERGIRKLKIKQKISGTFRSDTGADAFHGIHSIADTAWKNGQSPLNAILALV